MVSWRGHLAHPLTLRGDQGRFCRQNSLLRNQGLVCCVDGGNVLGIPGSWGFALW
ncbi:hypothetical protein Hanom_Chr09g00857461 [Helianthus anomalus]